VEVCVRMKFRIDVFTAAGSGPSGGPITEVLGVSVSERLNQVGEVSFTIPAAVAAQRGLARGNKYRIYHTTLGYIGEFKHIESSIDASAEMITIRAYDSLINLAERVAGFRRNFNNLDFSAVATALFNTSLGWTVSYEGGTAFADKITYSVEGENYLRMADYLRKYVRGWFRREGDTAIRFGKFLSTTPVVTFVAAPLVGIEMPSDQAIITQIARTRAGGEIANRLYPVGAGLGQAKLDLRFSNRTTASGFAYPIQSTTISTSTSVGYYIEDTTSIAQYGAVERVVAWNEIRPITNSAADLQNAGNALYDIASAYLQKYRNEIDAYTLTAVEVPNTLRVGDLVRLQYNGVAELENGRVGWLSVANNFWVTEISRAFDAAGEPQTSISISAKGEAVIGDTEVLYDILGDVQTLKLRTQPTQTYFSKSSDTVNSGGSWWGGDAYASNAFYTHRFGPEVLAVNEMYLEITTRQWFFMYGLSMNLASSAGTTGYVYTSNSATTSSTDQLDFTARTLTGTGGSHDHVITVYGNGGGSVVYIDETNLQFQKATTTNRNIPVSNRDAHDHNMDHKHALINAKVSFGTPSPDVVTVSTPTPRIGLEYTCGASSGWIELDSSNTTLAQNTTGQSLTFGTFSFALDPSFNKKGVEGYGLIRVNVTSIVENLDWKNNDIRFDIKWSRGRAAVATQIYGRVTIQPIAV